MGFQSFIQKYYPGKTAFFLPKGAVICGPLQVVGNGEIDGLLKGDVNFGGKLVIGKNAEIKGDVYAKTVEAHGKVQGDIYCTDTASITNTAVIKGNVTAAVFDIKEGAFIEGKIIKITEPSATSENAESADTAAADDTTDEAITALPVEEPQPEKSTDLDKDAEKWF